MKKIVVLQSPAHLYEVVPVFYKELQKLNYFDEFYIATDKKDPWGLGKNVHVVQLEKDLGWEGNLEKLLQVVPEDLFVMMCDDHVTVKQTELNLDRYFETMQHTPQLGRLQLSPPTLNYYRFLRARQIPVTIPDDSQLYYSYDKRFRWHLNFQPSIWRKDFLQDVIRGGGNRSQLELRASERARNNPNYVSGYIGLHAVRYENFLASCQVDHADSSHHRKKKMSVYREEFARYAVEHNYPLDPQKLVYFRSIGFTALVPADYCMAHYGDLDAYRKFEVKRNPLAQTFFQLKKRVRAKIAPFVSFSTR